MLSRTFAQRGFQAIAFDHIQAPHYKVFHLDLCKAEDQSLLCTLIRTLRPTLVWLAPPCGTASRAKDIPAFDNSGNPISCPLRSNDYPDGLPDLPSHLRNRVLAANHLYGLVSRVIHLCEDLRIPWILENPANSYMWITSPMQSLPTFPSVRFHNCMYGGSRPKLTQLLFHGLELSSLHVLCDDSHPHLPWRVQGPSGPEFQTAIERAYPKGLCQAIVHIVLHHCLCQGHQDIPKSLSPSSTIASPFFRHRLRGGVGIQPRGRQLAVLPNGFDDLWIRSQQLDIKSFCPEAILKLQSVPPGSRFPLDIEFDDGSRHQCQVQNPYTDTKVKVLAPVKPEDYVGRLSSSIHPANLDFANWPWMCEAVEKASTVSKSEILMLRANVLKSLLLRANELRDEEAEMHEKMDPIVASVNKDKKLILLDEISQSLKHPDLTIVEEIAYGFELVGWMPKTELFEPLESPMAMLPETLDLISKDVTKRTIDRVTSSRDTSLEKELFEITKEEVTKLWLSKEIDFNDLPDDAVVNPRFAIQQGQKIRAIDDYTFSGINACVGCREKVYLQGVDDILSLALELARRSRGPIVGRTYDLDSAYRQLAIAPSSRKYSYIACYNPHEDRCSLHSLAAMPFGAVASVYAFLRTALLLNRIVSELLFIPVTSYFDDFVVITDSEISTSTGDCFSMVMKILGFSLSGSDKKNKPFAQIFDALGVTFVLNKSVEGMIEVTNTDERKSDLTERIQKVLDKGAITGKEATSLRSRLNFADSQIYGRTSAMMLKHLSYHEMHGSETRLSSSCSKTLSFYKELLVTGLPRRVAVNTNSVAHVFLDGAIEESGTSFYAGVGGVLTTSEGLVYKAFGYSIPETKSREVGGKIHQIELLPIVMACVAFGEDIRCRATMFHIDNTAAQSALINAGSSNQYSSSIIYTYLEHEQHLQLRPWFARVGTYSNIADGPSRGDFALVRKLGATVKEFTEDVFDFIIDRIVNNRKFDIHGLDDG